jgi:predicted ATPase
MGPTPMSSSGCSPRPRRRTGRSARPSCSTRQALSLWRGPAYAEFADEDFVRAEAARLAELRRDAEEERVELALRLGRTEDAIARLEPMVREHPLRDRRRGQLVLALYRAGRQAEALARHEEYRRLLADELGIDPSPELQALHERVLRQDPGLADPPVAGRARPAGNLPAIDGGLVGRAADLAAAVAALRGGRVVTLTGPGGVGKTRLALTACAQAAPHYPDGAWLVELAPVPPGEVADAVMTALGVQARRELSATERVAEYLRPLRLLLLLDNCEHVAGPVHRLVTAVVAGCPGVTVLATSREALSVAYERVRLVRPLPVPAPGETGTAVGQVPAVRLFLERAAAAAPDFVLDAGNAAAVAALCRGLDGLPLALELAAPRLRAMSPAEIVDRLDARFALLAGGRSAGDGRHRTLHTVVDWSYELLDCAERHVFEQLSVFAGAYTLAAAEAVRSGGAPRPAIDFDVASVVASLVDRSMITAEPDRRRRATHCWRRCARTAATAWPAATPAPRTGRTRSIWSPSPRLRTWPCAARTRACRSTSSPARSTTCAPPTGGRSRTTSGSPRGCRPHWSGSRSSTCRRRYRCGPSRSPRRRCATRTARCPAPPPCSPSPRPGHAPGATSPAPTSWPSARWQAAGRTTRSCATR